MFNRWLTQKKKKNELWISDNTHSCNVTEKCKVTNMSVRVYELKHSINGAKHHLCFSDCSLTHLHSGRIVLNVTNVFICETTGKFHVCNDDCNEPIVRSRNLEHVCRMSGMTKGSEYHDTYTTAADKGECSTTNNRKRKFISAQNGTEAKQKHERWLCDMGLESRSLNIAVQMVDLLIFNVKRQQLENERLKKMRAQSKAIVITYKRRCEKADNRPVCLINAQWLYCNNMQRNRPPPYLHTTKATAERISRYYAYFCMTVYAKLLKYVFEDDDIPSLKDCIPPILYIMREGLKTTSDIPLFTEDMFLASFLPEENTLNHFGIKKTQFTNVRNRITNDTANAIENNMLCPEKLTVVPLSLEHILYSKDESIHDMFTKINKVP